MRATEAELFDRARAEYLAHVGKVLLTKKLHCYIGEDSDDRYFDPPIRVRVLDGASDEADIARTCEGESRARSLLPIRSVSLMSESFRRVECRPNSAATSFL